MAQKKLTADDAYRALHDKIIAGDLKPGAKLREVEIAESLGVSRTPVREALRRLESDGLLTHAPHKGAVVKQLDFQSISELYKIREVLEGTAAGLAARQMSEVEIAALYDMLPAQIEVKDNEVEASRLNKLFHRTICHGASNRYLIEMIDGLDLSMALLGRSTLGLEARKDQAISEHRKIIDAIAVGDAVEAEAAARKHIRSSHAARLKILLEDS
ncbi:GntR family transcriptional regulator [Litoreibacter roseus]|uniref:GntR family transcriptional regulator n=1 Tax=Litoreibacter roseus TaxID=2601869 RepID=A0A6N6JAR8_9RHOB|nr:GntR family transcriptional regulator [Litoreibacter roseus]GFE63226.1 GntR family transcriptional regulator [Litoreibacter roseus]